MAEIVSSAYSDDGQRHRVRRGVEDIHAPHDEPDTGVSITAELSDHRVQRERPEEDEQVDNAIYEQPNESEENASHPSGSIGDHDILSENIKPTNFKKFGKNYSKPFTVKPACDESDGGMSKEAHRSTVTKVSQQQVAVVSQIVAVPDTSRSIQNFGIGYDKLYAEFRDELIAEYASMRGCYMGEYQGNYDQNTSRKDDRIAEMNAAIQAQVDYIKELYDLKHRK